MRYRPEIDGLRAVAIIPVVLFHSGFSAFGGGYTGVDVFFVISGFLITSIIYNELEKDKFSIVTFYERRARRILPLLFFILSTTVPLAWISLFQVDMIDYAESLIATSTFSSNFLFSFEADYFDASVELKPLLHTWSLAVEEQYYILFPLLMMFVWKYDIKRTIVTILIIIGIISLVFAEWASFNYPAHNFYLLPSRAWELAIGALLAIIIRKPYFEKIQSNESLNQLLSLAGFAMVLIGFVVIDETTRFPSSWGLLPTVGSALIIGFANPKNLVGKLLSTRAFVFIGLISYSLYLWHHPILAFNKLLSTSENTFLEKSLLVIAMVPLSYLSWKYVENPFRNKQKYSRKFIFTFSIIGSLFFISLGLIGVLKDGFPNREVNTQLNYLSYTPDNRELQQDSWVYVREAKQRYLENPWFDPSNDLTNMVILGNSHGKDLYNAFLASEQASSNFELAVLQAELQDTPLLESELYGSDNYADVDIVVIATHYYEKDLPFIEPVVKRLLEDNKMVVITKEHMKFKTINSRTLADVAILESFRKDGDAHSRSKDAQLVEEVNHLSYESRLDLIDKTREESAKIIDRIKADNPQVIVLEKDDYMCSEEDRSCFVMDLEYQKYFFDARHTTMAGAEFFGKRIDEINWLAPVLERSRK